MELDKSFLQHDNSVFVASDEQYAKLDELAKLIVKWNGLSLIAKSTESDVFGWHIDEALSICELVKQDQQTYIDFGAGSGVIGIALSIVGIPNIQIVERADVKLDFIKNIAKFENAYAKIDYSKINTNGKFNLIIRGVDKIDSIMDMFQKEIIQKQLNKIIFFKSMLRTNGERELRYANRDWFFDVDIFNRQGRASGNIIVIKNISSRY